MPRPARLLRYGRAVAANARYPTCSPRYRRPVWLTTDEIQRLEQSQSQSQRSAVQEKDGAEKSKEKGKDSNRRWKDYGFKVFETSSTTLASILILGLAGYSYHRYYKRLELEKIEIAFEAGYSTPELASLGRHPDTSRSKATKFTREEHWITRDEQAIIDDIVSGKTQGTYHLIFGEKGTGKTSMLIDSMKKVDGEGVAMLEAHGDLEVFRVRLGKALNYDFHEDYIGGAFSFRGPRDSTPLLDIERAFNKMEKVALQRRDEVGKPLVIIINMVHLLRDDEDGKDLLELIQQRAELWAASNLVTVVFNSDDYWVSERLKQQATRMMTHSIADIPRDRAIASLKSYRQRNFQEDVSSEMLDQVFSKIGGRPTFLSRVARARDMLEMANRIVEKEKLWFLSQCWILGKEMDDDVQEHQKYCASAMLLARALVMRETSSAPEPTPKIHINKAYASSSTTMIEHPSSEVNNNTTSPSSSKPQFPLPQIPLHEARQIMTRADFLQSYDHANIITIDSSGMVRAASVPMQNAFRDVCLSPGFEEHLRKTMIRLDELESLERTREVTLKDLWNGGEYRVGSIGLVKKGDAGVIGSDQKADASAGWSWSSVIRDKFA